MDDERGGALFLASIYGSRSVFANNKIKNTMFTT